MRVIVAAMSFVPVVWYYRKLFTKKLVAPLLAMGFFGNTLPAFLFPLAQTQISSVVAGVLNSLAPLFTFLLGALFFGIAWRWLKFSGVVVGLLGAVVVIVFGQELGDTNTSNAAYAAFAVLATVSYGVSANVIKTYLQDVNPFFASGLALLMMLPGVLCVIAGTDIQAAISHPQFLRSLAAITFLGVASTVFANVLFVRLVQMTSALFGTFVAYLIPIVAIILGLLTGDPFKWGLLAGTALIASGVWMSRRD